ncbi:hypothetical protein EVAR_41055_1 [Eumeta japonica]|uniref:Uncharacterized protein n=1 Tax=Eumeta variegata TaxID=151549 RepID=A0A4C1XSX5_EUMVA|nr:hypothetical protein EVAR_41055_1 [Eumeta japonica]
MGRREKASHVFPMPEGPSHASHAEESPTTAVVTEHTAVSVNNVNTMRAYLKIVPVELYGPEGGESNRAKGRRETLRVSSVGGNEITDENRGSFELKSKACFSKLETHDSSDHQKPEASSATRRARHRRSLLALDRYR